MGMEFKIVLEEGDLAQPPPSSPSAPRSPVSPITSTPTPFPVSGQPAAQQAALEHTLLPALAAAAPTLSRELYSWANEPELLPALEKMQPVIEGPQLGASESILPPLLELRDALAEDAASRSQLGREQAQLLFDETGALRELCDFLRGDLLPELKDLAIEGETPRMQPAGAATTGAAIREAPVLPAASTATPLNAAEIGQLEQQFGKENVAAMIEAGMIALAHEMGQATGEAFGKTLLPEFEELRLEREEERGILPPLAEMRLEAELPGAEAERQHRAAREKAARENVEKGPAEIEEPALVIDPAEEAARRRLDNIRYQNRVESAYAKMTGQEEPVYDAIDAEPKQQGLGSQLLRMLGGGRAANALEYVGQAAAMPEAGAAGGALEALGGVAAAAGPAGAALLAAKEAGHVFAVGLNEVADTVRFFGEEVKTVIDNDYVGALNKYIDHAAEGAAKMPILGEMYAAEIRAATAPLRSFTGAVEEFVQRGKQLQQFSPELAQANAMAEVRSLFADLHEADVLGPDIARLTDNFSQFMIELREIFLPVKAWLAGFLADAMGTIVEVLRDAKVVLSKEFWKEFIQDLSGAIENAIIMNPDGVKEYGRALKLEMERLRKLQEKKPEDDEKILERLYDLRVDPATAPRIPDAARLPWHPAVGPFEGVGL